MAEAYKPIPYSYDYTDEQLKQQAENTINPLIDAEIEGINNATQNSILSYEKQKDMLAENRTNTLNEYRRQNEESKKDIESGMLSRGLYRSTLVDDYNQRADDTTNRAVSEYERNYTIEFNSLGSQISALTTQRDDALKRLEISRVQQINAKIEELRNAQNAMKLQIDQFNEQQRLAWESAQLAREQFEWQKSQPRYYGGGGSGSSSGSSSYGTSTYAGLAGLINSGASYGEMASALKDNLNRGNITSSEYADLWKRLRSEHGLYAPVSYTKPTK